MMKPYQMILVLALAVVILIMYATLLRPSPISITVNPDVATSEASTTVETASDTPSDVEPSEITLMATLATSVNGLGLTVVPLEVVEDSRCPVDENVRCIQAGTVRLRTKITNEEGDQMITLTLGTAVTLGARTLELMDVLPSAHTGAGPSSNDYRFVFKITK